LVVAVALGIVFAATAVVIVIAKALTLCGGRVGILVAETRVGLCWESMRLGLHVSWSVVGLWHLAVPLGLGRDMPLWLVGTFIGSMGPIGFIGFKKKKNHAKYCLGRGPKEEQKGGSQPEKGKPTGEATKPQ
jgi:hypothetical protein